MEDKARKKILDITDVKMHFPYYSPVLGKVVGSVKAVDGVSFSVYEGETFGIVGESGCGKTTVGRTILRVATPTSGKIEYLGIDIGTFKGASLRKYHRDVQTIFQDPYSSLDPRQSVGSIVKEALLAGGDKKNWSRDQVKQRVNELLTLVELNPSMVDRYPHEMSGGQRQRLGIARALACDPKVIVCDEPVSALDVSIQAQIINLFKRLQDQLGITYVFVAHDLAVVRHISDRIAVMYLGKIVEITDAVELYDKPLHPYTKSLLSAIPLTDYHVEKQRERVILPGEVPSPIHRPKGCPFHPRCIYATERCRNEEPELRNACDEHKVACHLVETN